VVVGVSIIILGIASLVLRRVKSLSKRTKFYIKLFTVIFSSQRKYILTLTPRSKKMLTTPRW